MWEPVICTGKGLAVMIANLITALLMVIISGGVVVVPLWGLGRLLMRVMPTGIKSHCPSSNTLARILLGLIGCVLLAMLITSAYDNGKEICAKGWREVFILTASPEK